MKLNSFDSNTNFCWRYTAHRDITALAVDKTPKLKKYKNIFVKFAQKPDFDERGFQGNNHFYYTPQLFRPRESFLDITGRNNAAARFAKHLFYFEEFVGKDNEKAFEHAGRAIHFLQDVTQPQHTERGTVYKKWQDLKLHKEFEEFAQQNQDTFIKNAKPAIFELETDDPSEIFDEVVFLSENGKQVRKNNKNEWYEIAQTGISNAIQATKVFCEYIASRL